MLPFPFPPTVPGAWHGLDAAGRALWLECARERFFDESNDFMPDSTPGRRVVLDGRLVDDLAGFYCAIGEAVNGPGGYFGWNMQAFDDCLFTGFGLEYPYTLVWQDWQHSRRMLDHRALLGYLEDLCRQEPLADWLEQGRAWYYRTHAAALRGEWSLFDELADCVRSVTARGGGPVELVLP